MSEITNPSPLDEQAAELQRKRRQALHERVDHDFIVHIPRPGDAECITDAHELVRQVAHGFVELVPEGRELSLILTKLDEVLAHACNGIRRHGPVLQTGVAVQARRGELVP
jgi:hypothetical protein